MSADNSRESGSSRSRQETAASKPARPERYSRAEQRALQEPATALQRQRNADRGERYAAAEQARQDQLNRAQRLQELAGRGNEIERVAAVLAGTDDAAPGAAPSGARGQGNGSLPPKPAEAGGSRETPRSAEPPADDLPDDDDDESRSESPKSLADFAGESELDIDELYALTVSTDDGESYTLGELKDGAKRLRDLDDREADFDDQRERHYNEIAARQQNIEALLNRLKDHVPADVLARAAMEADGDPEATRVASIKQLREWFPEWKDNQAQQRDRERVETRLTAYGFSKFEVRNLTDARIIRFLVETARKLDRYDRLRATPRDKIPTTQAPSGRAKPSRTTSTDDRVKAQAAAGDKIGAIATLLGAK